MALFSELFPSHAFKVENTNGTKLGVPTCKLNRIGYPGSRSAITVQALGQVIKNTVKLCIFHPCSAGPFVLRDELVVLQVSLQSIPSFFSHIALMTSSQSRHSLPKPKRASQHYGRLGGCALWTLLRRSQGPQLDGFPYLGDSNIAYPFET